jgi:hypothetical protein
VLASDESRSEIRAKGLAIYNDRLKAMLEPDHNKEYVAIHVDTGDYALGKTFTKAANALIDRVGADGRVLTRRVGDEPDYLLASRILAAEGRSPTAK